MELPETTHHGDGSGDRAGGSEAANVVEPKVELEYKIVLFDRKLSGKQKSGETKILPSPTYIEASVTQTKPEIPYDKTGKLTFTPSNVDAFTDEACTKSFNRDLTAAELIGAQPTKIWLRGTKEGKYNVKLTLPTRPIRSSAWTRTRHPIRKWVSSSWN